MGVARTVPTSVPVAIAAVVGACARATSTAPGHTRDARNARHAAAHRAALREVPESRAGDGARPAPLLVGVLGCGIDVVHPRTNADLIEAVARTGILLSEYWWDLPPVAWRFPARNRVIAALADAARENGLKF